MTYKPELGYKPRILIAEDDKGTREEYRKSLEKAGFKVTAVEDGSEIEAAVKEQMFNVILCDTDMPKLGGPAAYLSLLEKSSVENILIIGMSDNPENQRYWRGLCHLFFDKYEIYDIGEQTMLHFYKFVRGIPRKI